MLCSYFTQTKRLMNFVSRIENVWKEEKECMVIQNDEKLNVLMTLR